MFTASNMRLAHHVTDEQFNHSLYERPSSAAVSSSTLIPHDSIPTSGTSRLNNDIRDYFHLANKPVAGGAWLERPEVPNSQELLREKVGFDESGQQKLIDVNESIRPHRLEGAYESNEDYLSTKYELLREDAVRPLRQAISEIRANPFKDEAEYQNQSIGVYDPVYITSLIFSPRGLATRICFSLSRVKKHIR